MPGYGGTIIALPRSDRGDKVEGCHGAFQTRGHG